MREIGGTFVELEILLDLGLPLDAPDADAVKWIRCEAVAWLYEKKLLPKKEAATEAALKAPVHTTHGLVAVPRIGLFR
jgi:hypothetical protein